MMGKRLSDKNPFLRDPEKKKRLMVSAITSSQRQEGIDISDARAEEVYKIVFEEPPVAFFRLTQAGGDQEGLFAMALADEAPGVRFGVSRRDLLAVDGAPLSYWLPAEILQLSRQLPRLQPSMGHATVGGQTSEDARLVRCRWEVPPTKIGREQGWVPFAKGGEFSRFYADVHLVIGWDESRHTFRHWHGRLGRETSRPAGLDFFFRPGLTWPYAAKVFNVRLLPADCAFGHKGPCVFPKDPADSLFLLGVLDSSAALYLCKARTSREEMGGRWESGAVQVLPVPTTAVSERRRITSLASGIHDAKAAWDKGNEISTLFKEPLLAAALREHPERPLGGTLDAVLAHEATADSEIQTWYAELDAAVFDAYGLSSETRETVLKDLGPRPPELIWPQMEGKSAEQKRMEHAVRLLSFCVKQILEDDDDGIVPLVTCNNEPPLEERVLAELGKLVGADRAHVFEGEIASELRKKVPGYKRADSIGDFLANAYFEHHVRLYKSRPIFWHLASARDGGGTPAFAVLAHYHRFRKDALRKLRGTYVRSFIERRERELAQARKDNRTDDALERQEEIEETQAFDKKLQGLEEGHFPIRVPWKKATEQPKGWDPDIDDGVKVNILPLQTAGLLRIARVVSTKGAEEEDE
jgi:hypothetical protein